ncbi:MAG: hypothetical protein Q9211_006899, partial [Gyalolechia sp. 1 TL-2023]
MPPRSSAGGVGHGSVIDSSLLSANWDSTTIARDFASDHIFQPANNNVNHVDPAAANRSDRNLAPSVVSEIKINHDKPFHSLYQHQQQLIPTSTTIDQPYLGSGWSGFPHSIPTPPNPSPSTPFGQTPLRDGSGAMFNGSPMESAATFAFAPSLTPQPYTIHPREAATSSADNPRERTQTTASARGFNENMSPTPGRGSSVRKKQRKVVGARAMTPAVSSQRGEDGQKSTPLAHKQAGSRSSTQSNQSQASLDFTKADRWPESSHAPGILRLGQRGSSSHGQSSLPDEKGFSIQVGSELFKLSGASIMSDGRFWIGNMIECKTESLRAPSYFSAFFLEQLEQNDDRTGGVRTLFIDRDPETFREIARHLQGERIARTLPSKACHTDPSPGYLVSPKDGDHFVKLFADAQFYRRKNSRKSSVESLTHKPPVPRLQSQLFESEILVEVGNEHFRIPRDIFSSPGDTPNYFTLGFTVFFSSPGD